MARKISVVGSREHLKKSIACLLVRRMVAVWVEFGVSIERVPLSAQPANLAKHVVAPVNYIPETLPPVELPGIISRPSEGSARLRAESMCIGVRLFPADRVVRA